MSEFKVGDMVVVIRVPAWPEIVGSYAEIVGPSKRVDAEWQVDGPAIRALLRKMGGLSMNLCKSHIMKIPPGNPDEVVEREKEMA